MAENDVLMPEVLKLLIALVCIVLLLVLAFNLYGIITKKPHPISGAVFFLTVC